MKILRFLWTAVVSLGLVAAMGTAQAGPEYRWKLAQSWPTNFPIFGDAVIKMADRIKKMSQGQMEIRIDSKNKHKAPLGILDMVKNDQYQLGHSASYYWKGKDINTLPFTTMPFGMTAPEQYAWFYYGGGMDLIKKVYDRHRVYAFPGGNTGNQMGGWFRKEINGLDDLKGLKMRIPGFAGEVLSKLGVLVTNIPAGELYTALDRGTVDALEWVGPSLDLNMGFHKIAPFYYTGWHEPATELIFIVNKKRFDALPEHLQVILSTAMEHAAYDMYAHSYHESAVNLAAIKKDYSHIEIRTFPKEVTDRMKEENQKLLAEKSADNPLFKEIMASQAAYLRKAREWTRISDYSYLKDNIGESN